MSCDTILAVSPSWFCWWEILPFYLTSLQLSVFRNCRCSHRVLKLAKWFDCYVFSSTEFRSIWWCLCWPHGHYRGRLECSCPVDWQVCDTLSIVSSKAYPEHSTPSINGVILMNNQQMEETHKERVLGIDGEGNMFYQLCLDYFSFSKTGNQSGHNYWMNSFLTHPVSHKTTHIQIL